jgi:hypothetical protein
MISPAFHNIFVEVLINARDHVKRDDNCNKYIIEIN